MRRGHKILIIKKNKYIILVVTFCLLVVFLGLRQLLVNSGSFQLAMKIVENNAELQQHLGKPIDHKFLVMGNVSFSDGWYADLEIPLYGPEGNGMLIGEAKKNANNAKWVFSELFVALSNGESINLLPLSSKEITE